PVSPLFPYTTLFRSPERARGVPAEIRRLQDVRRHALIGERLDHVGAADNGDGSRRKPQCLRVLARDLEGDFLIRVETKGVRRSVDRKSTRLNSSHDQ